MNCEECYYYEEYEPLKGFCHRNPPDNGVARVRNNWWCGEFKTCMEKITIEGESENGIN